MKNTFKSLILAASLPLLANCQKTEAPATCERALDQIKANVDETNKQILQTIPGNSSVLLCTEKADRQQSIENALYSPGLALCDPDTKISVQQNIGDIIKQLNQRYCF